MSEVTKRFPWEPEPPSVRTTEETVTAIQRDLAYMVTHTAVRVHSNRPELTIVVNTPRGQIIPMGEVKYRGGYTVELQDIGMPQPGAVEMKINELAAHVHATALFAGLELEP